MPTCTFDGYMSVLHKYFDKSVTSRNGCSNSSLMHLEECLKTHVIKMIARKEKLSKIEMFKTYP